MNLNKKASDTFERNKQQITSSKTDKNKLAKNISKEEGNAWETNRGRNLRESIYLGRLSGKVNSSLLKMDKKGSLKNDRQYEKTDDYKHGFTSERWCRQTMLKEKKKVIRGLYYIRNRVDSTTHQLIRKTKSRETN